MSDSILDDLFHGWAWAAYIERAITEGGPPDSEATRRLAYQMYARELRQKHTAIPTPTAT